MVLDPVLVGGYRTITPRTRLRPKRKRRLPCPIRLDLEFLPLTHHLEEPLMSFMAVVAAVGGR